VAIGALVVLAALGWASWSAVLAVGGLFAPDKPVDTAMPSAAVPTSSAEATVSVTASSSAAAVATASAEPSLAAGAPATASGADPVRAAAVAYPGAPAVAPASYRSIPTKEKLIAITLDDGMAYDPRLLELLEKKKLRLTTFLTGEAVRSNPKFVKRLVADGFEIANHTWDHKNLSKLSSSGITRELEQAQAEITKYTGNQAPYMRPPGGSTNTTVKKTAAKSGYKVIMWTTSFADTNKAATADTIQKRVLQGLKPGAIILCHWKGTSTYEGMVRILPLLEARGYRVVTLSELVASSKAGQ
jgi:peptidoglycan/xylan/chitin deacetylase (PgdA/CDA1 family)